MMRSPTEKNKNIRNLKIQRKWQLKSMLTLLSTLYAITCKTKNVQRYNKNLPRCQIKQRWNKISQNGKKEWENEGKNEEERNDNSKELLRKRKKEITKTKKTNMVKSKQQNER